MKPPFPANSNRMTQYPSSTKFRGVEEDWTDSDDGSINGSDHNIKPMSKDETSMQPSTSHNLHSWGLLTMQNLKPHLKKWNLRVSGRKYELIERLEDYQKSQNMEVGVIIDQHMGGSKSNSNVKKKKSKNDKLVSWQFSKAKAILIELHLDDKSPVHSKSPEEVYALRAEFKLYPFDRFKGNLKSLREAVRKEKAIIAVNERDYLYDQTYFPRKEKTSRGVHFWDTHPANALLQKDLKDIKEGKKEVQLPSKLRMSRKEYQAFSVKTFCAHVHQEKRNQREKAYWIPKRNKDGMKKHEEEVNTVKTELAGQLYIAQDIDETCQFFEAMNLK